MNFSVGAAPSLSSSFWTLRRSMRSHVAFCCSSLISLCFLRFDTYLDYFAIELKFIFSWSLVSLCFSTASSYTSSYSNAVGSSAKTFDCSIMDFYSYAFLLFSCWIYILVIPVWGFLSNIDYFLAENGFEFKLGRLFTRPSFFFWLSVSLNLISIIWMLLVILFYYNW